MMKNIIIAIISLLFIFSSCIEKKPEGGKLDGVTWKLTRMSTDGKSFKQVKTNITINFHEKNTTGFGGCNSFFGSYDARDANLKISKISSTRKYCKETSKLETEYFDLLRDSKAYTVKDGKLYIFCNAGGLEFKATKQENTPVNQNQIKGYFSYFADAALFYPCGENVHYPVKANEEYLKMEKKYLSFPNLSTAQKVFCIVKGKITRIPKMEGNGSEQGLVIEKFISMNPTKKCE